MRLVLAALLLCLVAYPASAQIIFEEEFVSDAAVALAWPDNRQFPEARMMHVDTAQSHSGGSSLHVNLIDADRGGSTIVRDFAYSGNVSPTSGSIDEVYVRLWNYYAPGWFSGPTASSKYFFLKNDGAPAGNFWPNFWFEHVNQELRWVLTGQAVNDLNCNSNPGAWATAAAAAGQPVSTYIDTCIYYSNGSIGLATPGTWQCLEAHIKMNTPGVADGVVETWVDGTLVMQHAAQRFRPASIIGSSGPLAAFKNVEITHQSGTGDRFTDQFAVGRTRIGCGTGPAQPSAPTNLSVTTP